ncbi:MAG TPA: hypothetical protein VK665_17000 [Candidatus Elarobacter sp.]|nr:hypothetical protein [Candidatus Elarobacter sp.]
MTVRRLRTLALSAAFAATLVAPASFAAAQSAPPAAPAAPAALTVTSRDSAIVKPLAEIGRVRARTPYCAALAKARPGIDAAITFEYLAPALAKDLRAVRFDSELHRHLALRHADADLAALGEMASRGRAEVRALRQAAYADGVDDQKRQEMLALANAIDGAKERQKFLAKSIARTVGIFHEIPIHTVVTTASDDSHAANPFSGSTWQQRDAESAANTSLSPEAAYVTQSTLDMIEQQDRAQTLFATFNAEQYIREDMADAAKHAKLAMEAGGCAP